MAAKRRRERVTLVCHREYIAVEMTHWATVDEALEAIRDGPCHARCERVHTIAYPGDGKVNVIDAEKRLRDNDIHRALAGDPDAAQRLLEDLPPEPKRRRR